MRKKLILGRLVPARKRNSITDFAKKKEAEPFIAAKPFIRGKAFYRGRAFY
jgi:hypothetical protein